MYIVMGSGESDVDAIRDAVAASSCEPQDDDCWTAASVLFPRNFAALTGRRGLRGDARRWCVFVDVEHERVLENDSATLCYAEVSDYAALAFLVDAIRGGATTREDLDALGALWL